MVKVILVGDFDPGQPYGDTWRTLAFASGLQKNGIDITLICPQPANKELAYNLQDDVKVIFINSKKKENPFFCDVIKRRYALINTTRKKLIKENILLIETSPLAGDFALAGFKNYFVDVHGISYDELQHSTLPWYISKKIYQYYTYQIEKLGLNKAGKIIVVSDTMSKFIQNEWGIPFEKIELIPNGYFQDKIKKLSNCCTNEERGTVVFAGVLTKWARLDKLIKVAGILKNNYKFYIVGDGPYRIYLENMAKELNLNNIFFTGKLKLEDALKMIRRAEVVVLPFPKTTYAKVACPIKILDYMALGKAMVLDGVCDMARFLGEKEAALVCDTGKKYEFASCIHQILSDAILRNKLGKNALKLSKEFSWEKQSQKLATLIKQ